MPHPVTRPAGSLVLLVGLLATPTVLHAGAPEPAAAAFPPEALEFFEAKVRPILVETCQRCHGPQKQSSGLRLDSRAAVLEGGLIGPAVIPGDPANSPLIQAVRREGDLQMPPKGSLPEAAVRALTEWVKRGAPWPQDTLAPADPKVSHWAFQPVRQVEPPAVEDTAWAASPIDAFILAKLEAKGLPPSPRADQRTLIRRATFDLTGLPPTPEEVAAFEADDAPDAFARLVDRLLGSPRYGERWGRHWLDVARYADTKGYVFQEERRYPFAYTYRDYVIRAFNDDLPYDQFLVQQIAADLLPLGEDTSPLAAMGFLTVGRRFLNNREDIIDDRIDVVTRGLLGLTVSCARCHDHKFDPIPTADYYSLYGVFASSVEPKEPPTIVSPGSSPDYDDYQRQLGTRRQEVETYRAAKQAEILAELRGKIDRYLLAAFDLDFDPRHPKFDERFRAETLRPELLRRLMRRWGERLTQARATPDPVFAPWHAFAALPAAGFSEKAAEVAKGLATSSPPALPILARSFAEAPPKDLREVARRYGELLAGAETRWQEQLKANPSHPGAALADPAWEALRQVLYAEDGPIAIPADELGRALNRAERERLQALAKKVDELNATHPGAPPRAMVLNDAPQPTDPHVFLRGNPGRPGPAVPRQFLKVLSGPGRTPFKGGSGRLDLAREIVRKDNPLTARVLVNRVWMHHFGSGLVRTPSDFGLRSDPPTHPELLDDLAARFVAGGWSLKALHRLILNSAVYQQRSDGTPEGLAADPQNLLLWRQNRRRLDFEAMRDALLAVSGRLDATMGGRPVPLADSSRRTVYAFIDRQNLDGVLRTFDFASPDTSSPRRYSTLVPQQALFLMNSPFVAEQARLLSRRLEQEAVTNPEGQVRLLYLWTLGRAPEPHELSLALGFLDAATQAASPGMTPVPPLELFAQVLLMTNEFAYVD
jgi:hypothetical protein